MTLDAFSHMRPHQLGGEGKAKEQAGQELLVRIKKSMVVCKSMRKDTVIKY